MALRLLSSTLLTLAITACGDDRLPAFATGEPPDGFDAGSLLDASLEAGPNDAAPPDADR